MTKETSHIISLPVFHQAEAIFKKCRKHNLYQIFNMKEFEISKINDNEQLNTVVDWSYNIYSYHTSKMEQKGCLLEYNDVIYTPLDLKSASTLEDLNLEFLENFKQFYDNSRRCFKSDIYTKISYTFFQKIFYHELYKNYDDTYIFSDTFNEKLKTMLSSNEDLMTAKIQNILNEYKLYQNKLLINNSNVGFFCNKDSVLVNPYSSDITNNIHSILSNKYTNNINALQIPIFLIDTWEKLDELYPNANIKSHINYINIYDADKLQKHYGENELVNTLFTNARFILKRINTFQSLSSKFPVLEKLYKLSNEMLKKNILTLDELHYFYDMWTIIKKDKDINSFLYNFKEGNIKETDDNTWLNVRLKRLIVRINDLIRINNSIEYGYEKLHHDPTLSLRQNHGAIKTI